VNLMGKHDIFMAKRAKECLPYGGHDPEDFQHQGGEAPTWIYILIPRLPINFK
jgi:hypothetical protein